MVDLKVPGIIYNTGSQVVLTIVILRLIIISGSFIRMFADRVLGLNNLIV